MLYLYFCRQLKWHLQPIALKPQLTSDRKIQRRRTAYCFDKVMLVELYFQIMMKILIFRLADDFVRMKMVDYSKTVL